MTSLFRNLIPSSSTLEQLTENNVNEFPHGTCRDMSKEDVMAKCLEEETMNLFKTHSPMTIVFEKDADNQHILSESNLDGPFEKRAWNEIVIKCEKKSNLIKECKDVRVITTVDERIAGTNFTLNELIPADASFDLTQKPEVDIIDFLLKIGAIVSTAFGYSLYTIIRCRWRRYAKDGKCCGFGFESKIEDPETRRVTQLEEANEQLRHDMEQSRRETAQLRTDLKWTSDILNRFVETVDPIRKDIKILEVDVGQLKQTVFD